MFSGIVTEIGRVEGLRGGVLRIAASATVKQLELGASVAVNGICLTVTSTDGESFSADVMPETVARSSLSHLKDGSPVNLERPLRYGEEVGGHLVQGHVDAVGRVEGIAPDGNAKRVRVSAPKEVLRYCAEKGSIALDGVSLTITAVDRDGFEVSLIPTTLSTTIAGSYEIGSMVNLEVDLMAKYAERLIGARR